MATSSAVTAGTNATASDVNDVRTDAITQYYSFFMEVRGDVSVANDQAVITVPASMTITEIYHRCQSGSGTIRIQKDTSDVKASISTNTGYQSETSGLSNTSASKGEELRLDVTASSSMQNLRVLVMATRTI